MSTDSLKNNLIKAFIYNDDSHNDALRIISACIGTIHIATAIALKIIGGSSAGLASANFAIGALFLYGGATGAFVPIAIAAMADIGWYFAAKGVPFLNLHIVWNI